LLHRLVHTQAILLLQAVDKVQQLVTQQVRLVVALVALVEVQAQETRNNLAVVGCQDKAMLVEILVTQVVAHTLPLVEVVRALLV
jgi:hypothetical protein